MLINSKHATKIKIKKHKNLVPSKYEVIKITADSKKTS